MGTRADFYVGKGLEAEWLGSVAWDGDEWEPLKDYDDYGEPFFTGPSELALYNSTTEDDFRACVEAISKERDDFRRPEDGWPWPWPTSDTTDVVYWFENGTVHSRWPELPRRTRLPEQGDVWPDMSARENVTDGGFIVVRARNGER